MLQTEFLGDVEFICENNVDDDNNCAIAKVQCEKKFYHNDEVCRVVEDGTLEFGVITTDSVGDKNNLNVLWTSDGGVEGQDLYKAQFMRNKVALIDRHVKCGDMVLKDGNFGEITNVEWRAYVRIPERNQALIDIKCDYLQPILPFEIGNRVELNNWIGIIKSVTRKGSLIFPDGNTCSFAYSHLPVEQTPYPGRKISCTTEQLAILGARALDDGQYIADIYGNKPPQALVMFLKVQSVEIDWKVQIPLHEFKESPPKPKAFVTGSTLKRHLRNLDTTQFRWEDDESDVMDKFYFYTVRPGDKFLPMYNKELEKHIISEFFLGQHKESDHNENQSTSAVNAPVVVNILRTCRTVDVEWNSKGVECVLESMKSYNIDEKHCFDEPFRQIVQKKVCLAASNSNEYGVTLVRCAHDTVEVQWFQMGLKGDSIPLKRTTESKYDLEPHFKYGNIIPGEIVCRSDECILPNYFQFGLVQQITKEGNVIVTNWTKNVVESLLPFDIEVLYLNKDSSYAKITPSEMSFQKKQIVSKLTERGNEVTVQESLISPHLLRNYNLATLPSDEKFKILPQAPTNHHYYTKRFDHLPEYIKKIEYDRKILTHVFAEGLWVKGYADRKDLFSVMMVGQKGTPYEDGLFNFDVQLPLEYPEVPPNFYLTTKLCSDFNHFAGLTPGSHHFAKLYTLRIRSLLEALLAVHKFIFEGRYGTEENRKSLQETMKFDTQVSIAVLDSLFKLLANPPINWRHDVVRYIHATIPRIISRLSRLTINATEPKTNPSLSPKQKQSRSSFTLPLPPSKGYMVAIANRIRRFQDLTLTTAGPRV